MPNFAVVDDLKIINIIVADSLEIAEDITNKECFLIDENLNIGIGYIWNSDFNSYISPKPYASWTYDNDNSIWYPPVSYPDDGERYEWDEKTQSWLLLPPIH